MDDRTDKPAASSSSEGPAWAKRGRLSPRSAGEAIKPTAVPPPPPRTEFDRRPKGGILSTISALFTVLLIAAFALGSIAYLGHNEFYARGPLQESKVIVVKGGNQTVAETLQRAGVINHSLIFVVGLHLLGANDDIKAGEYEFSSGASMKDVMDTLVSGKSVLHPVTVPEGLTSEQVVARLMANDLLTGEIKPTPLEGSLLPETYKVERGTTRQSIIDKMMLEQRKVVAEAWEARNLNGPLKSPQELVTLASIVEKETSIASERPLVAGVFTNRLQKGMRLQSDPTIVYGLVGGKGTLGRGIKKSEITQDTPYNTYVISALPPGPIANPGRASLMAVARPAQTEALYFVADGKGGHRFSSTLDEHNRYVREWRKIETERRNNADDVDRVEVELDETASSDTRPTAQNAVAEGEAGGVSKAFDASEGTDLDPLKNKTFDLNSAKIVPKLQPIQ